MFRIFCLIVVGLTLTGCVTSSVSFQNAPLGSNDHTATENIHGIFAKPAGKGPFPAVVLLHTCGGVLPHVSQDWPNFLTANGFAALTVDTFGSRNAGKCPHAIYLRGQTMARDAYGALEYLASRPDIDPNRIGVMGFSLGAMAIEGFATAYGDDTEIASPGGRTFKAGIAVYGVCAFAGSPKFPVLEIIGDQDKNAISCPGKIHPILGITNPAVSGVSVEILPGATHAFDNSKIETLRVVSGDHQAIYDWDATKKAREFTRAFFTAHLKK